MKPLILSFLFLWISFGKVQATSIEEFHEPMIISLGSHCEVADAIKSNKFRVTAFPFDWLLTIDLNQFLSLLEEDFAFLMDRAYLNQQPDGSVINTKYNVHFRHDWFTDRDFEEYFPEINEKYERRIHRFRELNEYKKKVYFIRAPFDPSLTSDPISKEHQKIDCNNAEALRNTLRQKFPNLDFHLVIINYVEEQVPIFPEMEKIIEFKVRKTNKGDDYTAMIQQLILHANCGSLF